jgi:hypothetical protein
MSKCDVCGNDYDKSFDVVLGGNRYTFDSFECAVHALAPTCSHCGCRIMGHGLEDHGTYYCCRACAMQEGVTSFQDRI